MAAQCPTCGEAFEDAQFCPSDGARLVRSSQSGARAGELVGGRYRLIRLVGEGAMGEVYEAEHVYIHKRAAVKMLRPALVSDAEAVERLHREARAASAIGHDNIVQIDDFGVADDGQVFLAMEWLDGETVAEMLERGPITPGDALDIAAGTCAGLAAAHEHGVVHRDLKPANIFWARTPTGQRAKILDFGIAKLTAGDSALTRTGTMVGTPYYMAPEQALGRDVDARADLYAMGVILYELFTGDVPFRADVAVGVVHQHISSAPVPPRVRAPERGIDPAVEEIVLRCLEKDPGARYASAAELGDALAAVRGGGGRRGRAAPVADDAPIAGDSVELAVPRRRGPLLAVLAVLALAIAAAVVVAVTRGGGGGDPAGGGGVLVDAGVAAGGHDAGAPAPDATAPEEPAWRHSGAAEGFSYEVAVRPRVIATGAPAELTVVILPDDPRIAAALAAGELAATLRYVYFADHAHVGGTTGVVRHGGRFTARASFARRGKYHVDLALSTGDGELARTRFDVCVGVDPEGASAARVCPKLNPPSPPARDDAHDHEH